MGVLDYPGTELDDAAGGLFSISINYFYESNKFFNNGLTNSFIGVLFCMTVLFSLSNFRKKLLIEKMKLL